MIAYVSFAIIVVIILIVWLAFKLREPMLDDDWMEILTVKREKEGLPEGFTTKAKCPECEDAMIRRHFLRAAEPEGDLIECSIISGTTKDKDWSHGHWWVRGVDTRMDETGTTEEGSG